MGIDDKLVCRSDADNQMILYIPFNSAVRLSGIILNGPQEEVPTTVKLYINRSALDFDDVTDIEPAQALTLKPSDYGNDIQQKLKVAKFTAVNSLFLFAENANNETVALHKVAFIGQLVQGSSDMSKLKKGDEE